MVPQDDPVAHTSMTLDLNAKDLAQFAKWLKSRERGPVEALSGALFVLGIIVMIIALLAAEPLFGLLCGTAVVVSLVVVTRASNSTKRQALNARAALASGTLTADDASVRCESRYSTTTYLWNAFAEVVDTGDHLFLLTLCPDCAVIVPKRDFENRQAAGAFADFADVRIRGAREQPSTRDPA